MGRQGARLTQVDRKHVNGKENRLLVYTKQHVIQYAMHLDWWNVKYYDGGGWVG